MKEGREDGINEGRKEVRKEVVRLPENCAASRTDPTYTIPTKSL